MFSLTKVRIEFILIFLTGIGIGFILTVLYTERPIEQKPMELVPVADNSPTVTELPDIQGAKKLRIFCFLLTMPASHNNRTIHIRATWHKHCDRLCYASTVMDVNLGTLAFDVEDSHGTLWGKVKGMFKFIHENFHGDYDWVFKGDDDTFLIPENLQYLASAYDPEDPVYFGYKYNTTEHKWGYFSGGSGYVMSRKAVSVFVEEVLAGHVNTSTCPIEEDGGNEDWIIGLCLDQVNIYPGDGRDLMHKERFFPFTPQSHLIARRSKFWYWERKYYNSDEGLNYVSNYSVSFHYITPRYEYLMYYFTYLHRVYGIKRRYPPLPKKRNFSDVVKMLELERTNSSYRGY